MCKDVAETLPKQNVSKYATGIETANVKWRNEKLNRKV